MQKNHPKSNALRQTKICMAAAAVVTAAALPGYAVADLTWEESREERVTNLTKADTGLISNAEKALRENETKLINAGRYKDLAEQVEKVLSAQEIEDAQRLSNLRPVAERINVEVSRLVRVAAGASADKALHQDYQNALTSLQSKVNAISSVAKIKTNDPARKALDGLVKKESIDGIVNPAQNAAVKAQQDFELLTHKSAALSRVASKDEYNYLTKTTFLLDANAAGADKNGEQVISWGDANLKTFDVDTAAGTGADRAKIAKEVALEIGSFSGDKSDAIHGIANGDPKTAEIGTLRALNGAKHDVQVKDGALNIHQAIESEGNGELSVTLGKKGVLNFKGQADEAKANGGIKGDNVTLVAGSADVAIVAATTADGAKITFGDRTSAGKARIDLHSGASLEFGKGSDAGNSKITVARSVTNADIDARKVEREAALAANLNADLTALPELTEQLGATLVFEESSAANADIVNAGAITFTASDLSTAKLKNVAGGTVTIQGKEVGVVDDENNPVNDSESGLQVMETKLSDGGTALVFNQGTLTVENTNLNGMDLQSVGKATIEKSIGGKSMVANLSDGDLAISETQLQNMKLVNAGKAAITKSKGGEAFIANIDDGELAFSDADLQRLALANEGTVKMSGKTVATDASIKLHGGSLDVSAIAISAAEAGKDKPENSLTIGSLSGKGDVVTGDTVLMLGELGNDDHFEGKISREAAKPTGQAYPNVLNANAPTTQPVVAPVGSQLVKVGTGNLTLAGDQSGVTSLSVQGGTLTAAHANALGSGTVNVAGTSTVALSTDVSGVKHLQNDGTVDLGMNKLEVGTYASEAGATIKSRIAKVEGEIAGGKIHVTQIANFANTKLDVAVADDIEIHEIVGKFEVVNAEENAAVTGGELTVGSITGG
ncbi:hypothetical protein, partial [Pandoraea bronchicola]|uniref:hypothetical protein n=1 Tax=Pandoraea bronchicola TaxID=2508287 RepID=UPI001240BDF1